MSYRASAVYKNPRGTLAFADVDTVKTYTLTKRGIVSQIHIEIPNWNDDVAMVLTILNSDGKTLYTSAALARDANYTLKTDVLVGNEEITYTFTLGAAPGGSGGTLAHTIYMII